MHFQNGNKFSPKSDILFPIYPENGNLLRNYSDNTQAGINFPECKSLELLCKIFILFEI